MKANISFEERAKLGFEILSKQEPITLEQAKVLLKKMKKARNKKNKK